MRKNRWNMLITGALASLLLFGCGSTGADPGAVPSGTEAGAEAGAEQGAGADTAGADAPESTAAGETEAGAEAGTDAGAPGDGAGDPQQTADADADTKAPDYESIYAPVLREVIRMIRDGYDYEEEYSYYSTGIMERIMYPEGDDLMEVLGYSIEDLNGDGVPELLIGESNHFEYEPESVEDLIYSGYTVLDGEPVCFLEAWSRNRQCYIGNGHFCNRGSAGAWSSCVGEWHLEPGSAENTWDDFYFSEEDVATGGLAIYHNTTGIWDIAQAERVDMTEDAFYGLFEGISTVPVSWTSLSDLPMPGMRDAAREPLTDQELRSLENLLNSGTYYGFMMSFYEDPRDILWFEVFYNGAGLDQGYPSPAVAEAFLKATGDEEIFTDVTTISGRELETFVKKTTGYEYVEMRYPLDGWVYLKTYDLYLYEHGDTNYTQVDVTEGYRQDGICVLTYDGSFGEDCIVAFTPEGEDLRFYYNLPGWYFRDPEGGGDPDATEGMIFPDSDLRRLTEDDLSLLSPWGLRIARNEIYARHGRLFQDAELQAYFDALPWYDGFVKPDGFDESVLNEYETYNLKLISDYEKSAQ
ncbi:MAG: YARHG domain-containing protein [Lachnospiraceae bacterium]|nr:YARHG domain-containing protein [Lachnospiraceae bacterium]